MFMKNRFLKSALALSAVLAFVNCSEEATDAINNNLNADNGTEQVQPNDVAWLLDIGQDLLIYPAGIVTDANGSVVGTITFNEDGHTGSITAPDGTPIVDNIDVSLLEITTLEQVKASNTSIPASSATTSTLTRSLPQAYCRGSLLQRICRERLRLTCSRHLPPMCSRAFLRA